MRIKWTTDANGLQHSACGRFIISRTCLNPSWWGYWSLRDGVREYPCRTEASAKAAARRLSWAMPASDSPAMGA